MDNGMACQQMIERQAITHRRTPAITGGEELMLMFKPGGAEPSGSSYCSVLRPTRLGKQLRYSIVSFRC